MIALKDITSARLVRGKNDACGWHSWVEVEEDDIALAVDACWLYSDLDQPNIYVMETERYYEATGLKSMTVYTHEEFWSYELSKELYYRLSNSSKSTLAGCLLGAYRSEDSYSGDQFNYQIGNIANDRTKQRQFIARMIQGWLPSTSSQRSYQATYGRCKLGIFL